MHIGRMRVHEVVDFLRAEARSEQFPPVGGVSTCKATPRNPLQGRLDAQRAELGEKRLNSKRRPRKIRKGRERFRQMIWGDNSRNLSKRTISSEGPGVASRFEGVRIRKEPRCKQKVINTERKTSD